MELFLYPTTCCITLKRKKRSKTKPQKKEDVTPICFPFDNLGINFRKKREREREPREKWERRGENILF